MTKRKRFIITSIALSLGFIGIQFLPDSYRFISISGLGFLTFVLFVWSLREGLSFNMTLVSLILPFLYTIGVGLFWFLLPAKIFARVPIIIFYGLGIYALCLTSNIYTVAAIRTIALLRAAKGVGFVLSLLTLFLLFDTILSLRLPVYYSALIILLVSVPLFLQGFWSVQLETSLTFDVLTMAIIASLITAEIAVALFFWPVTVVVGSLFLTTTAYILLGLGQAELESRLFSQTVREYLILGTLVFLGMFLATRWGG